MLAHDTSIHRQTWPAHDEMMTIEAQVTMIVQVNGKLRDRIVVPVDEAQEQVQATALSAANVQRHIDGRDIRHVVVVPNQLVNIVV